MENAESVQFFKRQMHASIESHIELLIFAQKFPTITNFEVRQLRRFMLSVSESLNSVTVHDIVFMSA
jgi:hypothetical protein